MRGRIRIEKGRVVSVSTTTLWQGVPVATVVVNRISNGCFRYSCESPEDAEFQTNANLSEVLKGLHEKVVEQYLNLFSLENPTLEDIHKAGFHNHKII